VAFQDGIVAVVADGVEVEVEPGRSARTMPVSSVWLDWRRTR
jgi:hypothetical protein